MEDFSCALSYALSCLSCTDLELNEQQREAMKAILVYEGSLASHTPHDYGPQRGLVIALYQFRSLLQNLEEHTVAVLLMERVWFWCIFFFCA